MIFILRPPGVPGVGWSSYRHCWTQFAAANAGEPVVELPFSDESRHWIEEQARANPTKTYVAVAPNFIPYTRFFEELGFFLWMGKRAVAEEVTDLVYRSNPMEPDVEGRGRPGRAIRIYRGKVPKGKKWWGKKFAYQHLLPLYFDGDPSAPGYKCALGRILPVFWRGFDTTSGRAIYGEGTYDKVQALVRWDFHVRDWEKWSKKEPSIFFC